MQNGRVLIFCSAESLAVAKAVHENLRSESIDAEIWTHGMFRSTLDSRLDQVIQAIKDSIAGVVILNADDEVTSRSITEQCPRDNCILELGLLIGQLGKDAVYWIKEHGVTFRVPSDLDGLDPLSFHRSSNLLSATSPVCSHIATTIKSRPTRTESVKTDTFEGLFPWLGTQLRQCSIMTGVFIHSRRFFESYTTEIDDLLSTRSGVLSIYLPDLRNKWLIDTISDRFEDGELIPGLIKHSYRFIRDRKVKHEHTVSLFVYQRPPSFSLYVFDNDLLHASYPLTPKKNSVPATIAPHSSNFGKATIMLLENLKEEALSVSGPNGLSLDILQREYLI